MASPEIIPLWDDGSDHNPPETQERPRLVVFTPETPRETPCPIIVVFPGGGYVTRAPHEADPFARLFAENGYLGVVCHYRVKPNYFPAPMADAARGIRMVRKLAPAYGADPNRLAILGFSAGGHLVCSMATQPDLHIDAEDDLVGAFSARPDRLIAAYPVVSLAQYNRDLAPNLVGREPTEAEREMLSSELHVTAENPPTFLFHTTDDPVVPSDQSITFARALAAAGVSTELHVYASGPHGVGLAPNHPALASWSQLMLDWLKGWQA